MKTIYVKFLDPKEVLGTSEVSVEDLKKYCFKAVRFPAEGYALLAYAETPCTWSTLLDEDADVEKFIDTAAYCIQQNSALGQLWLQTNFV